MVVLSIIQTPANLQNRVTETKANFEFSTTFGVIFRGCVTVLRNFSVCGQVFKTGR
jgi:hypothetical protein